MQKHFFANNPKQKHAQYGIAIKKQKFNWHFKIFLDKHLSKGLKD